MRKALWISGAIVLFVIVGLVATVLLIDVNRFREPIQSQLEKGLHRQVKLGSISLSLFPLAITVSDCTISESVDFATGRPFATAKEIAVRVGLAALLRKQIQVDSLVLRQPAIELVRNPQGKWNFSSLGGESAAARRAAGLSSSAACRSRMAA
jgi:AsmA protein